MNNHVIGVHHQHRPGVTQGLVKGQAEVVVQDEERGVVALQATELRVSKVSSTETVPTMRVKTVKRPTRLHHVSIVTSAERRAIGATTVR